MADFDEGEDPVVYEGEDNGELEDEAEAFSIPENDDDESEGSDLAAPTDNSASEPKITIGEPIVAYPTLGNLIINDVPATVEIIEPVADKTIENRLTITTPATDDSSDNVSTLSNFSDILRDIATPDLGADLGPLEKKTVTTTRTFPDGRIQIETISTEIIKKEGKHVVKETKTVTTRRPMKEVDVAPVVEILQPPKALEVVTAPVVVRPQQIVEVPIKAVPKKVIEVPVKVVEIAKSDEPFDRDFFIQCVSRPALGGNVTFTDPWTGEKVVLPRPLSVKPRFQ